MKELAPRLFWVWSVALWKTDVTHTEKFSIGSPEGHRLPSGSSEFLHTVSLRTPGKGSILPASVLANPEAQFQ